jgi:hypothetical protein
MSTKKCLKCNHSTTYEDAPPTACPSCGAIYSKVEEALRAGAAPRTATAAQAEVKYFSIAASRAAEGGASSPDVHAFAEQMRAESLYPAWRKIVGLSTIACYILAALILLGSIIGTRGSLLGMLVGAGSAALIVIFAKVGKELSLMIADLSDAAVRVAAGRESAS